MSEQELEGRILKKANPKTIQDKFLVGYQGWFTCSGDGKPMDPKHHGWMHWFNKPIPDGGRPNTDLWPDVSEYYPSELFPVPDLKNADGEPMLLFSSRHSKTVRRHFRWMALDGVDGAFLQRSAGQCDVESGSAATRKIRDEVGDRVREAAEAEGRVFAIMYDVSGVHPDKIQRVLEQDWMHLMRDKCVLDSPNYLREKGKPVIALWGFGFNHSNHSPGVVSDPDPEFLRVWTEEFDALSPWTVGRYGNEEEAERWGNNKVKQDFDFLKRRGDEGAKRVDYMPVVLPGGSGYNLSRGQRGLNGIKRNGGHFLWKQLYAARHAGVRIIYGAMWDEYDEGTAFMPVVSSSRHLPVHPQFNFLALDADGHSLPSDWYMRIAGFAAELLRGERMLHETFPVKELQDYWATRPRYEETTPPDEEAEQWNEAQRAYHVWATQAEGAVVNEAPPPPYVLEDETQSPRASSSLDARLVSPVATNPALDHSSVLFVPSSSSPVSTRLGYPPSLNMTQQSYQQSSSSYPIARLSSRIYSPVPAPAAVTCLADNLARQTLTGLPSDDTSGLQQFVSGFSSISPSMQMPSVEVSPNAVPTSPMFPLPESVTPVLSWPQHPVQQHAPYNLPSHPRAPPLDSRPSLTPQGEPFGIGGPEHDEYDDSVHPHGSASFPRVEQYHPHTTPNSGAPHGSFVANKPAHAYPIPNPLVQDYCQREFPSTRPHSEGSQSHSLPEWENQGLPPLIPPRLPIHPQSSNQSTSMLTGIGRGLLALGLRKFGLDGLGFGEPGFVERRFGAGGLRGRVLNIVGRARGGLRGDGRRPLRGAGRGY